MLPSHSNSLSPPVGGLPAHGFLASVTDRNDPDALLVRLARDGDEHAFGALFNKYQPRVARHVAHYVKRACDVEDVVQEVFIKAHRGLRSFKGESAFYTWLYRIAKNAALNFVMRQRNVVLLQEDLAPGDSTASVMFDTGEGKDPESLLLTKSIAEAVERAMDRLQPDLAQALILYEVEGKQYKEIAQMLQIPIGTVRTRIFRAREFIAQRLEPIVGRVSDREWPMASTRHERSARAASSPTLLGQVARKDLRASIQ